jgi:Core-2/I-Branching enzyme
MKFAYLVLAHKNPGQLVKLCKALTTNGAHVHVHVDQKVDITEFKAKLAAVPGVHLSAQRWPVYWGGFNMINATLHMIELALANGAERLVLISGLDLPIKPIRHIESLLGADADHIETSRLPNAGLGDGDGFHRIWYLHAMDLMGRLGLKPRTLFHLHKLMPAFMRIKPPHDLDVRMGSQWWSLRASTARKILDFTAQRADVMRFFKYMGIPDEAFFQTLVQRVAPDQAVPVSHRLIVWDRHPKPYVFLRSDLDEICSSEALFARKFDEVVDAEMVDKVLELFCAQGQSGALTVAH